MLLDLIKAFEKEYSKYKDTENPDRIITDNYNFVEGDYYVVEEDFKVPEPYITRIEKQDGKKEVHLDIPEREKDFLRRADYMSRYIDSNKSIGDKNIHSSNYLSFFIKKENINNGKLKNIIIDDYYEKLKDPLIKYKKPKAKKLYMILEEELGKPDEEFIEKAKEWVKENIYNLVPHDCKEKTYIRIFFRKDLKDYSNENKRYILPNIYNSVDYNENINGITYGLPNDNMGLNSKKPFLENKTRKVKVPFLLDNKEVLMQKKLFDYLANELEKRNTELYVDDESFNTIPYDKSRDDKNFFKGSFIKIKKGKEVEMHDFDSIPLFIDKIDPEIYFHDVLNIEGAEYEPIRRLSDLERKVNEIIFSKFLTGSYFTEASDMRINDNNLKRNLLISRDALYTWFKKGQNTNAWKVLKKSGYSLVKGAIKNGYILNAGIKLNLMFALKNYFEGGEDMSSALEGVRNSLRNKINSKDDIFIENDKEYYYGVGQLTNYFISLNKGKNRMHSLAGPIIDSRNDESLKRELRKFFKKYKYAIQFNSTRFNNLYSIVETYYPEGEIDKGLSEDLIIAGYLQKNLIYEKNNKGEDENEK